MGALVGVLFDDADDLAVEHPEHVAHCEQRGVVRLDLAPQLGRHSFRIELGLLRKRLVLREQLGQARVRHAQLDDDGRDLVELGLAVHRLRGILGQPATVVALGGAAAVGSDACPARVFGARQVLRRRERALRQAHRGHPSRESRFGGRTVGALGAYRGGRGECRNDRDCEQRRPGWAEDGGVVHARRNDTRGAAAGKPAKCARFGAGQRRARRGGYV